MNLDPTTPRKQSNPPTRGSASRLAGVRSLSARHTTVVRPVAGLALLVVVGACGSGGSGSSSVAPRASTQAGPGTGQAAGTRPGASGTIAAVSSTNAQVQNQTDGQVTVGWTAKTRFSKTTAVAASAVVVGDCVTAVGGTSTATSGTSAAFTATTVTVSKPVNGSCTGALGTGGFGGGGARTGTPRAGATPRPNRTPPSGFGRFDTAFGTVTAVSGSTITVKNVARARRTGSTASPAPTPATSKVTIGSATTVEQTSSATSSALVVGECLTAFGKADDTGAVTATAISVRPAGKQGCTTGFGGRFGGPGGGAGGQAQGGPTGGTTNG